MAKPGLNGRWLAIAAIVRAQAARGEPCWLCQLPIDTRTPEQGGPPLRSRWSFSADHIKARSRGGESTLANTLPSHYGCNSRRGNGTRRKAWRARRWTKTTEAEPEQRDDRSRGIREW
jgi:5-methylcytosine-specific restriction endonuclease McrA